MKSFCRTLLAVILANLLLLGVLVIVIVFQLKDDVDVESGSVLVQTIDGSITEYAPPSSAIPFADESPTLTVILENLEKARHDKRIAAVVLRLGNPGLGWASLNEIRQRIDQLRRAGIPIWGYTDYLTRGSLYIGAACDQFSLFNGGYVSLYGIAMGRPFVKGSLEKLGIKDNLHRIEKYKSAAEIIQRKEMSPEARQNIDWMLDQFYPSYLKTIEADRGLQVGSFEAEILANGAMVTREALEAKLVDRLAHFDEIETSLLLVKGVKEAKKKSKDARPRPRMVSGTDYAKVSRKDAGIKAKRTIAIVHAQGLIEGERSGTSFPFGMTMGAHTMESALRQASENKEVEAIVLRVNSGGGESSTSWRIGRAVERAGQLKPMVVSMSDLAASGGYMISSPCSTLVAERLSVVGSIGSISGKFNMRGLYDKLGITWDFVTRGPNALMPSDYYDYTTEQYEAFASRHWMDYWEWVEDIARQRNMTPAAVDSVGRGRVWTGSQALAHGLIDTLGGLDVALEIAKRKAGIDPKEEVAFLHFPKKQGPLDALKSGGFSAFLLALVQEIGAPLDREGTWAVDWNDYR